MSELTIISRLPFTLHDDGIDFDVDGLCDAGDTDDANDGALDENDISDNDPFVCSDTDQDLCEDCLSGLYNTSEDGFDYDGDGLCDLGDLDDDNDGAFDDVDSDDNNENVCNDDDGDSCDECSSGSYDSSNDGFDYDADGACDAGDSDDDVSDIKGTTQSAFIDYHDAMDDLVTKRRKTRKQ